MTIIEQLDDIFYTDFIDISFFLKVGIDIILKEDEIVYISSRPVYIGSKGNTSYRMTKTLKFVIRQDKVVLIDYRSYRGEITEYKDIN